MVEMKKDQVSVVVPVYNVERYLAQCVDSILQQTYTPYEIILVDDGSTDNSGKIADEYAEKYKIIRVIHKENAGLGYARNTGIENARGNWIVFLDSDDYFTPHLLEKLVVAQQEYAADLVVGGYERIDESGNIVGGLKYNDAVYSGELIKKDLLPRLLGSAPDKSDSISMSACNALFSLNIIKKKHIRFPTERYVISEDLFFDYDYYSSADRIVLISNTEYKYRVTTGSLTKKYRGDRYQLCKNLYNEMLLRIDNNKFPRSYKIRLMRSMFNYWRMCLAQEKRSVSGKTYAEQRKSISELCRDDLTKTILKQYPMQRLGKKQKIFLFFVKYDMSRVLQFFVEFTNFIG